MPDGHKSAAALVIAATAVGVGTAILHGGGVKIVLGLAHDAEPAKNFITDAERAGLGLGDDIGTTGTGAGQSPAQVTISEEYALVHGAIAPRMQVAQNRKEARVKEVVDKLLITADPNITRDLESYTYSFTSALASDLIKRDMAASATSVASQKDSGVEFEVLSGKLKIDGSFKVANAKITIGEVNVYKVSAAVAAGVATCIGLTGSKLQDCVSVVLTKVRQTVTDSQGEKAVQAANGR